MYKKLFNIKLFLIVLIGIFLITSGLGCKSTMTEKDLDSVNLIYWRIDDGRGDFSDIINGFQKLHPHISITYRKIKKENYSQEILEAWAEDRGPDIFSIPNTWLGEHRKRIHTLPLNSKLVLPKKIT